MRHNINYAEYFEEKVSALTNYVKEYNLEALILGIIGIPLGILLGLIATFILVIISDYFLDSALGENFKLTFTISFLAILFSIILKNKLSGRSIIIIY